MLGDLEPLIVAVCHFEIRIELVETQWGQFGETGKPSLRFHSPQRGTCGIFLSRDVDTAPEYPSHHFAVIRSDGYASYPSPEQIFAIVVTQLIVWLLFPSYLKRDVLTIRRGTPSLHSKDPIRLVNVFKKRERLRTSKISSVPGLGKVGFLIVC